MKIHFAEVRKSSSQGQYFLLAILLTVTSFLGILSSPTPAHAAIGSATEYTVPNPAAGIKRISAGPDGNIWYTSTHPSSNTSRIVKMTPSGNFTEYINPLTGGRQTLDIAADPDGNIWFSELTASTTSRIVKLNSSGVPLGGYMMSTGQSFVYANSLVPGSDGDLWFTYNNKIGRISSSGDVTFKTPPYGVGMGSILYITLGLDGNIWYVAASQGVGSTNSVGKMTPSGVFTNYNFPSTYTSYARSIITGPDGNTWFTLPGDQLIVKVSSNGVMTSYSPGTGSQPYDITVGSDGNIWYIANSTGKVGRMTLSGVFTEFSVPGLTTSGEKAIVTGTDGAVWLQDRNLGKIIRVSTELASQTTSFTSTAPTNAVIDGPTYTPTASATSGLPVTITIDGSSSGICSMDGSGVISFQGAGTCTVNADQAGDADYKPAPQVQQSFNVLPIDADTSVALNCPSNARVGDTIVCTIIITNNGPAASENASLTALFPSSFTNVSISGGGILLGQHITWMTPSIASGDSFTLTLNATLSAPGKQRFSAALLQTSPDPSSLNNLVDTTVVVN